MTAGISLVDVRDPRQPITYINKSFERLTGYAAHELLGASWRLTEGPETDPESARRLHEAVDSGGNFGSTFATTGVTARRTGARR